MAGLALGLVAGLEAGRASGLGVYHMKPVSVQIKDRVYRQVGHPIDCHINLGIRWPARSKLMRYIRDQVWDQVGRQVGWRVVVHIR